MVFALFVPYFCDIPRVAITHLMNIPVTGKSLTYIIGLQMCSSSLEAALLMACGVVSIFSTLYFCEVELYLVFTFKIYVGGF